MRQIEDWQAADEQNQTDEATLRHLRETLRPHRRHVLQQEQRFVNFSNRPEGYTIYHDGEVQSRVKRVSFQRHKRFALDDALYQVKMTPVAGKEGQVKLNDCLAQIITSVAFIIQTIKDTSDNYAQLFVHFSGGHGRWDGSTSDPSRLCDLYLGGMDLQTPTDELAETMLEVLTDTFNSKQEISLDEGLTVNVTCVSHSHHSENRARQAKTVQDMRNTLAGVLQRDNNEQFLNRHSKTSSLFQLPEPLGQHTCVPVAAVVGFLWSCSTLYMGGSRPELLPEHKQYQQIRKLLGKGFKNRKSRAKAMRVLRDLVEKGCHETNLPLEGPHTL